MAWTQTTLPFIVLYLVPSDAACLDLWMLPNKAMGAKSISKVMQL
jgi:hypothetical protein